MGLVLKEIVLLLAVLCAFLGCWMVEGKRNILSKEREMQLERKLKLLNKPAVKSIQSEDGDIIDCVDIYKQPAFDHPLLKNHKIQMPPRDDSVDITEEATSPVSSILLSSQVWLRNGSCPKGTIPIRRVQKHHLLNAPSIENYGKKNTNKIEKHEIHTSNGTLSIGFEALHAADVLVAGGFQYTGARATINIWNPRVEADDEFSSSHISLRNGEFDNSNEINYGWIVNPSVYGDKRTRFFIHWTTDSGKETGCFDLLCSGFVQTSHETALGTAFESISSKNGEQYGIDLYVWKDYSEDSGNWWLVVNNETTVGYWPSALFTSMSRTSTLVLFGGDVYSPRMNEKPYTATEMGSGEFAQDHWGYASCIGTPRIRDMSFNLKYPLPISIHSGPPFCYSAENYADVPFTEPLFYFGGPGRNVNCP